MWTRQTADPLGKLLFEKYQMHMLSQPRENVSVFDVFGVSDGKAVQSGSIDSFLRSKFDKPEVEKNETLLDINMTASDAVSGSVGLNFLQGFLALLGAGVLTGVEAALEKSKSQALRFQFGGCTRDHVKDDFDLELKLEEHTFNREKSAMKEDYCYYMVTGVHYCKQLMFEVLDQNMAKVNLSAEVVALGGGNAGLTVNKERQITAASDRTLAYGVELSEVIYNAKRWRLELQMAKNYVHVKGADTEAPKSMIGGPDDLMMLQIVD